VQIEDASLGVAGHGEGNHARENGLLIVGGNHVGGEGGSVAVGVVNPYPGIEVLGVALGVGDVVPVSQQNVVDTASTFNRPDDGPVPMRGVDEGRVAGVREEPGVGPERAKVIGTAEKHAGRDLLGEDPGRRVTTAGGADRTGRAGQRSAP
jgi:hypothetical protein